MTTSTALRPWVGHSQTVVAYKDSPVSIDTALASLLQSLWRMGVETHFSCQGWLEGNPNADRYKEEDRRRASLGYIMFTHFDRAEIFYHFSMAAGAGEMELEWTSIGRGVVRFDPADLELITGFWAAVFDYGTGLDEHSELDTP
jgi:hypothetical protein